MTGKLVGLLVYLFIHLCILGLSTGRARNLLIQGGTLLDGTGKAPISNVRILIEGNKISQILTDATVALSLPPDTQVVNAQGKFIIPGLIDSHVHYREYMGELLLAYGVTAVYDLGNPVYWQAAIKKGLNEGKIHGPRFYFCGGITLPGAGGGDQPTVRARDIAEMSRPEDARRAVAAVREKSDCLKLSESVAGDLFTTIAREARAAGMGVISHSLNATDSAGWGITGIEHMVGVAIATIRAPEGRRALAGMNIEAGHKNSLLYQWMEPAYFQEVIDALVRRQVMINPTLHFEWKALMEHAREHELEDTRLLANPNLQYVPLSERLVTLGQYHWADGRSSADREQFLKGYRRVQEFLGRFVKAGGKIYSGTDSAAATTPGLSLHHEMELLVDAGLTPMDALRSSTQWAAEIIGLNNQLGTVEVGKLADLVILRSNPLDDIRRTKEVDQVIRGGEIVITGFHGDYAFPFRRRGPESKHLYNPIPVLSDVTPPVATQGAEVRLRVLGRGFVPSSVVVMDGEGLPTTWVSPTELAAVLPRARSARVGTLLIQVETPLPGGGITEPIEFFITYP